GTYKTFLNMGYAVLAPEFDGFDLQDAVPQSPALVARLAHPLVFGPETIAPAMRAGFRPGMPGRNPHHPRDFLDACNLVSRQTQYRF
ncbi:MAG TPA: hypothetical protein P5038_21725, partial [Candidatus Paceibacterota bacterium]|nr:hypothetical protein [Candidatus Paceibacterota bacterium]